MRSRFVLAAACAVVTASCDDSSPLAPSAGETTPGLLAVSLVSGTYNLTATATAPTAIALGWVDNSSREAGFEIQRSVTGAAGPFALYGTTGAGVTSFNDLNVFERTLYCYQVRAFTKTGKKTTYATFSETACATTPALPPVLPPPPRNVDATPASSSEIGISWVDNASTDDQFRVERAATSAGPWEVAAMTSSQVYYLDANRTPDQEVCYRVIAVSANGESMPSNVDCTAPPAGPTNLTATATSQTIDLSWADNSVVEDGYLVERSDDGVWFYSHAWLPANVTRFSDHPRSSNTTYWYRVRALKAGAPSNPSNVASATSTCAGGAPEQVCDNGVDDDCDGFADLSDPDCSNCADPSDPNCPVCAPTERFCANGADDDCDGLVDGADPDCPAPACDFGCPSGMLCLPDGFCYYPW